MIIKRNRGRQSIYPNLFEKVSFFQRFTECLEPTVYSLCFVTLSYSIFNNKFFSFPVKFPNRLLKVNKPMQSKYNCIQISSANNEAIENINTKKKSSQPAEKTQKTKIPVDFPVSTPSTNFEGI